jgi:hypothetical protein
MILKGSQRSGGQSLAAHLLNADDNEHVQLHELRGFACDDLRGAFKEVEAISRATRCTQYLFSLSLSPPEGQSVPEAMFTDALDRIETKLGLHGQPRAIVFHEKEGRRHAHCVWSRIDADTLTARPLPFFKNRLMEVSRELYLQNGWNMPRGLANAAERDPTSFSLAEWQQAQRQEMDPRWLKATVRDCWQRSDNAASFSASLAQRGFTLAKGDKLSRNDEPMHVIVDHNGEVYSVARTVGLKLKEARARLGSAKDLPSVVNARAEIGKRMVPALRRHVAESRAQFRERSATLGHRKSEMTQRHRTMRATLNNRHTSEWDAQTLQRAGRLPKGVRGLWHRITGKYQETRRENEAEARAQRERQAEERQKLIEQQLAAREVLQAQIRDLRREQAEALLNLRRDVGRFLKLSDRPSLGQQQLRGLGLRLER